MTTLTDIETLTKNYAAARAVVSERVGALREEQEAAARRKLPGIKNALAAAADAKSALETAIEQNRGLFSKPRTYVFAGIKVGLKKGNGAVEWEDDAKVVKLIRKYLPDQAETLIKTTEVPVADTLKTLSAEILAKLGCTVEKTGDHIYVKVADGHVDKLVKALLKEGQGEELEEAA